MRKIKIAYICWLSNPFVRSKLDLRDYKWRNVILRLFQQPTSCYLDYGIWNSDFVEEFKQMNDYEFHIISPHNGMKGNRVVEFTKDGIYYHIYKCDSNLLIDAYHSYSHYDQRTEYKRFRNAAIGIVERVKPDVIIVCGAEQPKFSPAVWDLKGYPTLVLLETAVNDPQLMKMMKGTHIYGPVEQRTFREMSYFATSSAKYFQIVRNYNKDAVCLAASFPSHHPLLNKNIEKQFDFIIYAAVISKNKGVEDTILAFNKVVKKCPDSTLNICGRCDESYKDYLESLIDEEAKFNVSFTGFFETVDEKLNFVQRARIIVLPGITAPLNSTVRESMLMGLPTIVYNNPSIERINSEKQCLIAAEMENIEDLSNKMVFALNNPSMVGEIANNGYEYAIANYSNKVKAKQLVDAAIAVMENFKLGKSIPINMIFSLN